MTAPLIPVVRQEGEALAHDRLPCRTCGGDGFTFHTSPTNGAIELDGPCTTCTGRTHR